MLNFNKEYFSLEKDRTLYPTSYLSKDNLEVYGRKKFLTVAGIEEDTAHVFKIPNDYYTINAGNLDFSNYPNGVWNDYISVKVVQFEPYFAPEITFSSMGDITPENLENLKKLIIEHLSTLEKKIIEEYMFIDEGVAENKEFPNLKDNQFWVRKNGAIVGVNLKYLEDDYKELKKKLEQDFKDFYDKTFKELQQSIGSYYKGLLEQAVKDLTKLKDDLMLELTNKIEDAVKYIAEQHKVGKLNPNETVINIPEDFVLSERLRVWVNGLFLTKDEDYTIDVEGRTVTLKFSYKYEVDYHLTDNLPPNYVQELIDEFYGNVEKKTTEFNNNASSKTTDFNNNVTEKIKSAKQEIDTYVAETTKPGIDDYVEKTTKPAINDYVEKTTKPNINDYVEKTSKVEINTHVENKIIEAEKKIETAKNEAIKSFDSNATEKTNAFNTNAEEKLKSFNDNSTSKTTDFNNNVTTKKNEFDSYVDENKENLRGKNLEFVWDGTRLGVRVEGDTEYTYSVDLKGQTGNPGAAGSPGANGKNLEFNWNGTQLGVRVQGDADYQYVDLKGQTGSSGANGTNGADGVGIKSIALKGQDSNGGNVYTITLTNNNTYEFTAPKGATGNTGPAGTTDYNNLQNKPNLAVYMPLSGNSTKSGNLAITGTLTSGEFTSSGNVTAYSDVRLKREFGEIKNIFEKISKVNILSYKMLGSERLRYGVVAQDLQKIFPELVVKDNNKILSVDYTGLLLLFIKGIMEKLESGNNA